MEELQFKNTLDLVKSRITLKQVIESYGISVPNANKFINCVFHGGDNTPSLKLFNADSYAGTFYCFGCKAGYDLLSFVERYENVSKLEALQRVCRKFGINVETREVTNSLLGKIDSMLKPKKSTAIKQFDFLRVAMGAQKEFSELKTANLTPYMLKKSIPHLGTKSSGTKLVIPICDKNDRIWNLQYIAANGAKWYMKDGMKHGGMFRIGEESEFYIFLSEGYSTAASVFLATGITTYSTFTANNLTEVHDILKEKYESAKIVVAGDNDNIGRSSHHLDAVYPPDKDMDFNDMVLKYGVTRVKKLLLDKMGVKE